ncbi:unnamed protein product [Caenorhabditis brenneri]
MSDYILVANVLKKDVIFSSTCLETAHQSHVSTQLVLEISKVTEQPALPVAVDKDKVLDYIDATLTALEGALTVGCFFAPELAPFLEAAAGVCSFVKNIMAFIPREDPVMKKMEELNKKIIELNEKTQVQFNDMKAFITENNFNLEILNEISILKKFVMNFLNYGTPASIESLRHAYEENPPLNIAYTLASLLDQRSTNPLMVEFDGQEFKSKETFDKWKKCVDVVLGDLLWIEAFACPPLKNENTYDAHRIVEQSNEIKAAFEIWEEQYKELNSERMWKDIKNLFKTDDLRKALEGFVPRWGGNQDWAIGFKAKIESYYNKKYLMIDYAYYTIFFDEHKTFDLRCPDQKSRLYTNWGKGNVNTIIYRSRTGNSLSKSDDEDAKNEIKKISERVHNTNFTDYFNEHGIWLKPERFYFLCGRNAYPAIRYANNHDHELGPGAWADINGWHGQWMVIGHP